MERASILHTFPGGSTYLAKVPSSVLRRPGEETNANGYSELALDDSHEAFMSALSASMVSSQSWAQDAGEEDVLSVMRVVPVTGSANFHKRLLAECESYCRLCWRLQHAVDWLLLRQPKWKNANSSKGSALSAPDVDSLSHVVYPLEPTAFLAAAFALPSLVAVASPLSEDEGSAAYMGRDNASSSSRLPQTVPYCFFYRSPVKHLLKVESGSGSNLNNSRSSEKTPLVAPRLTLMERVTAIANAIGVCGCVAPDHNTMSVRNSTRIGLTLSEYLDCRLPASLTTSDGGTSSAIATEERDPFSRWKDDILWRLLGLLVSALAVVHASGFHFRGELSPDDIFCFALPNDDDDDDDDDDADGHLQDNTSLQREKQSSETVGQRLSGWVKRNQRRWIITDTTQAHHAFFMFATLPRSLFVEESKEPLDVAAAQRRDTAAVGRIILTAVEEMKRRRGVKGVNSCSELLFVAERMAAMEGGGGFNAMEAEAPAHRFSQLQAVQLRTYLWLLRTIVEERDAQLAAALLQNCCSTKSKVSKGVSSASSHPINAEAFMEQLKERDRVLSEREKKMDRFLLLYELTAERLDELPDNEDGFDRLRQSLLRQPPSQPKPTVTAEPHTPPTPRPKESARARQADPKPLQGSVTAVAIESSPSSRTRPLYGLLRSSRQDAAGGASTSASTNATSLRSVGVLLTKEKRTPELTPRQGATRVSLESAARRNVVASSSSSLTQKNYKTEGKVVSRRGSTATTTAATTTTATTAVAATTPTVGSAHMLRSKGVFSGTFGYASTARNESSVFPLSSTTATTTAAAPTTVVVERGGVGISAMRERSPVRTSLLERSPRIGAAVYSSTGSARRLTPSLRQEPTSIPLSPDISPLMRAGDESASTSFLATGYKTPPRATSLCTPPLSQQGSPSPNVWNKLSTPRSTISTMQSYTPRQTQRTFSSRYTSELKMSPGSGLGRSPVTGQFSSPTPKKATTPIYNPSLYTPSPNRHERSYLSKSDVAVNSIQTAATPRAASRQNSKTPLSRAHSPSVRSNDSVQVIRINDESANSLLLNSSGETPFRRNLGDSVGGPNSSRTRTPNVPSPDATRHLSSNGSTPATRSLNRSNGLMEARKAAAAQSHPARHPQPQQRREQEETTTPRVSRQRLANDGWVDNKLEALEQLRYDFRQSELAKSARSTPSGKTLAKSARELHAAREWASTIPADQGRNVADASTWGGRSGQTAAQAGSDSTKRMY